MAQINVLDNSTIDKIAAGEVVERPSSVVKELVENAIDAGANAVTVEIKDGGTTFIRVTDNGNGIEKSQIQKAFLRHATSKIRSVEDLFHIHSLGFRGEALSSIAAVSKVELITKTADSLTGIRYVLEGAKEISFDEIGAPNGTTIMVRNLFFNTPVRRKFLKSAATEGSYISDLMEHLAMSKPDISFKYVINNQTKFHTSGNNDLQEVIYRIFGREITNELLPVFKETDGITLQGFLGKPTINRATRNFENYFVNKRYIKSNFLSKAIEDGYKSYLMQHKYPFAVLHLTIDPELIDINVHPTKMDIRFTKQTAIFEFLVSAIEDTLKERELIPKVSISSKEAENRDTQDVVVVKDKKKEYFPEPFEEKRILSAKVREESNYAESKENPSKVQELLQNSSVSKVLGNILKEDAPQNEKYHSNIIKQSEHIIVEKPMQMNLFEEKLLSADNKQKYKILGQLFDTYWLLSFEDKLFFMDQHAAHEKVKYERLLQKLKGKNITSQTLNPPIVITFSGKEEAIYQEYASYFESLGFEIEEFGGNEYAIRSVPNDLYGCNEKELFLEIMDELLNKNIKGTPTVIEEKLASMACKAAVKGNMSMTEKEVLSLMEELLTLENPYHCPHGRPTLISMTKYEIDKKFKRIL